MRAEPTLTSLVRPRLNSYIPHEPEPRQAVFLSLTCPEAFYGGAGGGGKSDALLMGALQYVDQPDYHALVLRKTLPDLKLPGALMDRSRKWLLQSDALFSAQDHKWTFPSGASITFGYLEHENDKDRYASAEFQYIAFDELTQFSRTQYTFLFSRLRRLRGSTIPLRMRSASNPGGIGHDWVYRRFVKGKGKNDRIFIPARLKDNPHIDIDAYLMSLSHLDKLTRARILRGDWEAKQEGTMFDSGWFEVVQKVPPDVKWIRYWDLAATPKKPTNDPDWTAGCLEGKHKDDYLIRSMRKMRGSPGDAQAFIRKTAEMDGREVSVWMEQEPGASGVTTIDTYAKLLAGFDFHGDPKHVDKPTRAAPLASQAQLGHVEVVAGPWNEEFMDELDAFPYGEHDDQVDAASGAFAKLTRGDNTGVLDLMREEYEEMMAEKKKESDAR